MDGFTAFRSVTHGRLPLFHLPRRACCHLTAPPLESPQSNPIAQAQAHGGPHSLN